MRPFHMIVTVMVTATPFGACRDHQLHTESETLVMRRMVCLYSDA
jgi:hypothetical protein